MARWDDDTQVAAEGQRALRFVVDDAVWRGADGRAWTAPRVPAPPVRTPRVGSPQSAGQAAEGAKSHASSAAGISQME